MEHEEAIRSQAAERYVAHELSPEEEGAFEKHFFDCPECAEDVRFELTFAANVRSVLREPAPEPKLAPTQLSLWHRGRQWFRQRPALAFSFAANVVWAAGFAFVLLTGARDLARPQFAQAYFAPGTARGAEDVHSLTAGDTWYMVRFLPSPDIRSYSYEILGGDGRREASGSLQAPAGNEEYLYLQVPVKRLPGGVHTLQVYAGGPRGEIVSRSRFHTSR